MKKKFEKKIEEEFIFKNADWFTRIIILKKKGAGYGKIKK